MVDFMTLEEMRQQKERLHLTNEELSQLSGISVSTISKIMAGVTRNPRYETRLALERVLMTKDREIPEAAADQGGDMILRDSHGAGPGRETGLRVDIGFTFGRRKGPFTVDDFYDWPEEERIELIDGEIYDMAAPLPRHQFAVGWVHRALWDFAESQGGDCRPFITLDTQLDRDEWTMVEPDLLVICDKRWLLRRCYFGAPDLVLEVLSPSTRKKDLGIKYRKYRDAGVREYWILDPDQERMIVHDFQNGGLTQLYTFRDKVPVGIWNGVCELDLAKLAEELAWIPEEDAYDDIDA